MIDEVAQADRNANVGVLQRCRIADVLSSDPRVICDGLLCGPGTGTEGDCLTRIL